MPNAKNNRFFGIRHSAFGIRRAASYLPSRARRPEHARDRLDDLLPARPLGQQLRAAGPRQPVLARPLLLLRDLPLRRDPPLLLEAVERGIERSGVDLQYLAGAGADRLRDPVAVARPPLQRPQDEEAERALQQLDPVLTLTGGHGCRDSTAVEVACLHPIGTHGESAGARVAVE